MIIVETPSAAAARAIRRRPNPGSGPRRHDRTEPRRIASLLEAGAAGDSPTTPSFDRSYAPDRQSHQHRPPWARVSALFATPAAIAPPTKSPRAFIKSLPCATPRPPATVKSP